MITPIEIVNHLAEYLPRVSDYFSEVVGVDSAVISDGRTITFNTTAAHGLSVASPIMVIGGQTAININTVSEDVAGVSILIEFDEVHDFTTPNGTIESESLACAGFNEAEWNTTLTITEVPTDQSVIVTFPTGATGVPTFTTAMGYEERPLSIFGTQAVATVPAVNQFTIELSSDVPVLPSGEMINVSITTGVRVVAADSITRADEIYTKVSTNNSLWAFVIMNDVDISKDRHTMNDSVASFTNQNQMRLTSLVNFSVVVFFKTATSISGATAQTLAYGQIFTDLLSVLYGFGGFSIDNDNSKFVTVTAGHGVGTSNVAYYTHVYDWQTPVDITIGDGFSFYKDEAFRGLSLELPMFTPDELEKLTLAITIEP